MNADLSRLQVRIKGVLAISEVEDDVVAADGLQRDRHGRLPRARIVFRNAVVCICNDGIGHRQHL